MLFRFFHQNYRLLWIISDTERYTENVINIIGQKQQRCCTASYRIHLRLVKMHISRNSRGKKRRNKQIDHDGSKAVKEGVQVQLEGEMEKAVCVEKGKSGRAMLHVFVILPPFYWLE